MGIVFGYTGCAEPSYKTLHQGSAYCVRQYSGYFIAEATGAATKDDSFRLLAKYIGVFGEPQNNGKAAMAMTAPVITVPTKMAMTSPVVTSKDEIMSFVLPFHFKSLSEIPQPTDSKVKIREIPKRIVAGDSFLIYPNPMLSLTNLSFLITTVKTFSGWYSDEEGARQRDQLRELLQADSFIKDGEAFEWSVAQYHPPFTLGFLRKNEIWIQLDEKKSEKIKELLSRVAANAL